jgi:hypothetical protein
MSFLVLEDSWWKWVTQLKCDSDYKSGRGANGTLFLRGAFESLGLKKQMPSTAIQYIPASLKRLEPGIRELFERSISERRLTSSIPVVLGPDGTLHEPLRWLGNAS